MISLNQIKSFLKPKKIIVAGVSRNPKKFGNIVFHHLLKNGFDVCPVNPNISEIDNHKCYKTLSNIPKGYNHLLIVTPTEATEDIVQQAINTGIKHVWFQQTNAPKDQIKIAQDNGLEVIYKRCILMFTEPVSGGHKIHRGIVKFFGRYPKVD